jgi:hypothetical protein
MRLDENLVLKLKLPNFFEKLFSAVKRLYESLNYVVRSFTTFEKVEVQENWEYQIDPLTHLRVLKVERDPMALSKTRNALKELFRTSE